jgi:hypothetical protein
VCTEALAVMRAVVADFFLDRWHVEIASDNRCIYIYQYLVPKMPTLVFKETQITLKLFTMLLKILLSEEHNHWR